MGVNMAGRMTDAPVWTYWVEKKGSQFVIIVGKRGLFRFHGDKFMEISMKWFETTVQEPPRAPGMEFTPCWGIEGTVLKVRGSGLVITCSGQAPESLVGSPVPVVARAAGLITRGITFLGGLGRFLFMEVNDVFSQCHSKPTHVNDFRILDLGKYEVSEKINSGEENLKNWKRFLDTPENKLRMLPVMMNTIRGVGFQREADVRNLTLLSFFPVFDFEKERVRFRLTYEYRRREADCTACHWEASILVDALPPDLAGLVRPDPVNGPPYPALAAVSATLPEGWRIYGYTTLSAPPARVAELRKEFLSKD